MTRRAGKEIALFRGRLNLGRTATGFALRSTKAERKRTVAPPLKGICRREARRFRRPKRNSRTKTLRKSRRTTKKTSVRARFFDGLGLLKSPAALRWEGRNAPDAQRRKTRLSTGNPPNLGTGNRFERLIPALAAAFSAETEDAKGRRRGLKWQSQSGFPSRLVERRRTKQKILPRRRPSFSIVRQGGASRLGVCFTSTIFVLNSSFLLVFTKGELSLASRGNARA